LPNEHILSTSRTAYHSAPNGRPSPTITIPQTWSPTVSMSSSSYNLPSPGNGSLRGNEVIVHTSTNWKKVFAFGRSKSPKSPHSGEIEGWWEDPDDPVHVLHACGPAMLDLWRDKQVRARLEEKRLRLEETSGLCEQNFFSCPLRFPSHILS
jgi:guanine nucleotide-binding protein subunit alpha